MAFVFFGYAWSSNIGWIEFNPVFTGEYGSGYGAQVENGAITGWAKMVSNDEWIWFDDDYSGPAQIVEDEVHSWAWGGGVVGWISFNCANENHCETSIIR